MKRIWERRKRRRQRRMMMMMKWMKDHRGRDDNGKPEKYLILSQL
jgi:hypothetical protein